MRPSIAIALSLAGASVVGYGIYLYLQARAVRALLSPFDPPAKPSPEAEAMRARLAALALTAPLRDWLRMMSDDRDSVTLDAAFISPEDEGSIFGDAYAGYSPSFDSDAVLIRLQWQLAL